ncbi:MAG: MFS transporter [Burkholderiales bacterium]|nr:MFS transporter [Burkholderiales bacterium]
MNSQSHQFRLLRERRFAPFFWTQFLGAGNDNIFKNALALLVTFHVGSVAHWDTLTLINIASAIFILPFVLFSATAGQIADKYEKSRLIRLLKIMEILVMILGLVGFWLKSVPLLFVALFLMGLQSTLFGPVKYAILPQHLRTEELVGGNGLVESATFIAILLGTIAGGLLIAVDRNGPVIAGTTCIFIATIGYLVSRGIPLTPAASPDLRISWNPFIETWRNLCAAKRVRAVWLSMFGISWFWFFGATFLAQFPEYTRTLLGGNEHVATLLLALFSIGLAVGALSCERLSGKRVEPALIFLGSLGLAIFAFDLGWVSRTLHTETVGDVMNFFGNSAHWRVACDLIMIGIFGGFYTVPLYVLLQTRSDAKYRSRIIAANNILNSILMILSAIFAISLFSFGATIPQLFMIVAVLTAGITVIAFWAVAPFVLRYLGKFLIGLFYRLRKVDLHHFPENGPYVIICNHVSYVDVVFLTACVPQPVRFMMDYQIYRTPILNWLFRINRAIPIASRRENDSLKEKAFDEAMQTLREGGIIAIFPEGRLSSDGSIGKFYPGITRILRETAVPVVPMALSGLWGSFFSRAHHGKAMRKFRGIFSRITIIAGEPISQEKVTLPMLRERVIALYHVIDDTTKIKSS